MAEVTAGLKDIASAGKRHYIWLAALVFVGVFLTIRYRGQIAQAVGGIHPTLAKWLNVTVAVVAIFFGLAVGAGHVEAAVCCAKPIVHAASSGGWVSHVLTLLAGAAGAGVMGLVAFPAPDIVEAKLANGSKTQTFTQGASAQSFDFFVDGSVPNAPDGRPLCATSQKIQISGTVENTYTGSHALTDDHLAPILESVQMHSNLLGTILDKTVGTGAILKHLIEFVGLGFNRGADTPVATVTVPSPSGTNTLAVVRHYEFPHAQRWSRSPIASALWLGIINQMKITVTLAPTTALAQFSTAAVFSGTGASLKVVTPVVKNTRWHLPVLAQWLLENNIGGSTTFTLRRFGEVNASGTAPVDYLCGVYLLSNLLGLGGNQAIDNILSINSPKLGISNCQNVLQFAMDRIAAQRYGQSPRAMADNGNYVMGTTPTGNDNAGLKFLPLIQPGLDMTLDAMGAPKGNGFELPIDFTYTSTPSTTHATVLQSMRFLNQATIAEIQRLSGGLMPGDYKSQRMA